MLPTSKRDKNIITACLIVVISVSLAILISKNFIFFQEERINKPETLDTTTSHNNDNQALPQHQIFVEAKEDYDNGEYIKARDISSQWTNELISHPEGCELLISIFARLEQLDELELYANQCLKLGNGIDTALDALGFAMSASGRIDEAIERLSQERSQYPHSERLEFTLSKLYFLAKKEELGRSSYLFGIQKAKIWSMWVVHGLRRPELSDNSDFMLELSRAIQSKENRLPKIENSIIAKLQELGLYEMAQKHLNLLNNSNITVQS